MFDLTNDEIEYLQKCSRDIETAIEEGDLMTIQLEIGAYLTDTDCMYYDSDGQNWYTEKGKYVQSLYDKILDWKYNEKEIQNG